MQKVVPVFPVVFSSPSDHGFSKSVFFTVDLERKTGITGVPFGRTELSIRASCREFRALASREGPVGPGIEGMPEQFDFYHLFLDLVLTKNMKMVDEHGWISASRAENDAT